MFAAVPDAQTYALMLAGLGLGARGGVGDSFIRVIR
jgi:hypothetical protein